MSASAKLLSRASRRLRFAWLLATSEVVLPVIVLIAFVLVAAGWVLPWGWVEIAALAIAVLGVLALLAAAGVIRITPAMTARAVDKGLSSGDTFTAALEFSDEQLFGERIVSRAERMATEHSPAQAVPWRPRRRNWAAVALVGLGAILLAVVANPQDSARAEAAQAADVIEEEADALDELAEDIADLPESSQAEIALAEELRALAEELRQLDDLELAQLRLQAAATTFAPDRAELLAAKAAAQGLDRNLEAQPLAGTTGSAAEQLAQLAAALDGLTPEQAQELADRLDGLAATQGAGNADAAAALSAAAAGLRAGDSSAARAALGEAATAQASGQAGVRAGQAAEAASSTAQSGAERLSEASDGSGEGSGDGSGDGDGSGEGSGDGSGDGSGEGSGDGSGDGDGSGEGSGDGGGSGSGDGSGGNPSGDVGGASGGSDAAGRGGVGNAIGGGDSSELGSESDTPTLFNPGGAGDELFPTNSPTGDPETVGLGQGPTTAGQTRVPISDVLGEFEQRAIEAADDQSIAPSTRALVRRYFDSLAGF